MNIATWNNGSLMVVLSTMVLLIMSVGAAPVDAEDEQPDNGIEMRAGGTELDYLPPWDSFNSAALHKLLMQLDADERLSPRVGRSWPPAVPRDWGMRTANGRFARQWRADKRQVRFRQCYFNPISCFRK